MWRYSLLPLIVSLLSVAGAVTRSGDGYISRTANTWTLGAAKIERKITLSKGRFFTSSLKNKITKRNLVPDGRMWEELRLVRPILKSPIMGLHYVSFIVLNFLDKGSLS
jgi:hypothetical protein